MLIRLLHVFEAFFRAILLRSNESYPKVSSGGLHEVKVNYIYDGDTVDVFWAGRIVTIRLSAIDCPEDGQPWGDIALAGLIKLIGGSTVYLQTFGLDIYGRTLAVIYVLKDSELINVNERMVAKGHAWVARKYYGCLSLNGRRQMNEIENWAKSNRVGLWGTVNPIAPWEWRQNQRKAR